MSDDEIKELSKNLFGNLQITPGGKVYSQPTQAEYQAGIRQWQPLNENSLEYAVFQELTKSLDKDYENKKSESLGAEEVPDEEVATETPEPAATEEPTATPITGAIGVAGEAEHLTNVIRGTANASTVGWAKRLHFAHQT